jgi:hypothetical protein
MTPQRLRLSLLLSSAALSALTLLAWTQQWFVVVLVDGQRLPVDGQIAAAGLSALALAGLALVGALTIAGPVFRVVLGSVQLFLGATVLYSAVLVVIDPVAASAATISEATGIAGSESVAAVVASVEQSAWPWVTLIIGALIVIAGIGILATRRRWPVSSRKYQAVGLEPTDGERSSVDDWDALSDGGDPTSR